MFLQWSNTFTFLYRFFLKLLREILTRLILGDLTTWTSPFVKDNKNNTFHPMAEWNVFCVV